MMPLGRTPSNSASLIRLMRPSRVSSVTYSACSKSGTTSSVVTRSSAAQIQHIDHRQPFAVAGRFGQDVGALTVDAAAIGEEEDVI